MSTAAATLHADQSTAASYRPLRIGNLEIGFPVVQAALSGYSDRAMRVLARRLGADYALCEVLVDVLVVTARKRGTRRFDLQADDHPIGGQLMGAEPTDFAAAARRLVETGYDVIDINFGCPVRKVLGRCRGGFLLSQPETALEIVARVREVVPEPIPVTVKMRRGLDDTPESRERFFTIFDGALERGVSAVTVHGRTVEQRYIGPSRWEFLREVKQHAGARTVLGSGDLFTAEQCVAMMRETGVDGVTAARGAIGNPWIFREARSLLAGEPLPAPPSLYEQREVIAEHYRLAEEIYGADQACRTMRKFGIKYSRLHPEHRGVRDAFVAVRAAGSWRDVLERWYAEDLPGRRRSPTADESDDADCEAGE
ncbi:MAG: tRNA dihydrouridine synthase [Pirellulales bacterium]